jgi:hypothetical protein
VKASGNSVLDLSVAHHRSGQRAARVPDSHFLIRVSVAIQFTSQVLPPSSENAAGVAQAPLMRARIVKAQAHALDAPGWTFDLQLDDVCVAAQERAYHRGFLTEPISAADNYLSRQ